jgi:hypothetical protein
MAHPHRSGRSVLIRKIFYAIQSGARFFEVVKIVSNIMAKKDLSCIVIKHWISVLIVERYWLIKRVYKIR